MLLFRKSILANQKVDVLKFIKILSLMFWCVPQEQELCLDIILCEGQDSDEINYEVENQLILQYTCLLTYRLMIEPASLPCQHHFEFTEIEKYLTETKKSCPICHQEFDETSVRKEEKMAKDLPLIEKLIQKRGRNNPWRLTYFETDEHEEILMKFHEQLGDSAVDSIQSCELKEAISEESLKCDEMENTKESDRTSSNQMEGEISHQSQYSQSVVNSALISWKE